MMVEMLRSFFSAVLPWRSRRADLSHLPSPSIHRAAACVVRDFNIGKLSFRPRHFFMTGVLLHPLFPRTDVPFMAPSPTTSGGCYSPLLVAGPLSVPTQRCFDPYDFSPDVAQPPRPEPLRSALPIFIFFTSPTAAICPSFFTVSVLGGSRKAAVLDPRARVVSTREPTFPSQCHSALFSGVGFYTPFNLSAVGRLWFPGMINPGPKDGVIPALQPDLCLGRPFPTAATLTPRIKFLTLLEVNRLSLR